MYSEINNLAQRIKNAMGNRTIVNFTKNDYDKPILNHVKYGKMPVIAVDILGDKIVLWMKDTNDKVNSYRLSEFIDSELLVNHIQNHV